MFYSYDVLNIRTGHLSLVWLAANKRLDYKRNRKNFRDLIGANVSIICDEIMKKISKGGKQFQIKDVSGRFSLYLSAMLMSGTVRIFENQVKFLLDEVTTAYITIRSKKKSVTVLPSDTVVVDKTQLPAEQLGLDVCRWGFGVLAETQNGTPNVDQHEVPRGMHLVHEDELLRQQAVPANDDLVDVDMFAMDWTDDHARINYPHAAHLSDITLREPPYIDQPVLQYEDFGQLEEQYNAKTIEEVLNEFRGFAEQTKIPEKCTPSKRQRINEETPARRPSFPTLLRPKRKNDQDGDNTIIVEKDQTSPASKIRLDLGQEHDAPIDTGAVGLPEIMEEIDQPRVKRPRRLTVTEEEQVVPAVPIRRILKKKRKLAIDHFTSLTHDELRANRHNFQDTLRSDNPLLDVMTIHFYKNILPANVLLKRYTGGMKLGKHFQNLLWTTAILSEKRDEGEVLRHLDGHESKICHDLVLTSSLSSIHDTKSRLSKSLHTSASLLDPPVETAPEAVALQSITEGPEIVLEKELVEPAFPTHEEPIQPIGFEPERRALPLSPDQGPVYVEAEVDVHAVQTPRRSIPEFRSPDRTMHTPRRPRYPMSSPEGSALLPDIQLSPIGSPPMPIVLTPIRDLDRDIQISPSDNIRRVLNTDGGTAKQTLTKLLPENATRKDVAGIFSRLLEMHKAGEVILSQEKCYGEITVSTQL